MQPGTPLLLGIDIGTGGVRALAATPQGDVIAQVSLPFDESGALLDGNRHEQPPQGWWRTVCAATNRLIEEISFAGWRKEQIAAVAIDGTSGTVVALDRAGIPLRPALMYNDGRATAEAAELNVLAGDFCDKLGYRFTASFALAKILWLRNHEPDRFYRTATFVHQADYIAGLLSGVAGVSDYSNALKTGYDLIEDCWPSWFSKLSDIQQRLPRVVAPGVGVGRITASAAQKTGLPEAVAVIAGASDGTAACLASGLRRAGDYNTTLGTTLVFKGVSRTVCRHPEGLVYCHKLPGGLWLPGAASNTGCEWMGRWFEGCDPAGMDAEASAKLPSRCIAYPLARRGERFPMQSDSAQGFVEPESVVSVDRYAACLQGVGLFERLCYQVLDQATGSGGGEVFSTGGGSRSDVWMQCRADATGRVVHRPACPESAFGAAVLAGAGTCFRSVGDAVEAMVKLSDTFVARQEFSGHYEDLFGRFCDEFRKRGYL